MGGSSSLLPFPWLFRSHKVVITPCINRYFRSSPPSVAIDDEALGIHWEATSVFDVFISQDLDAATSKGEDLESLQVSRTPIPSSLAPSFRTSMPTASIAIVCAFKGRF